MFSDGVMPADPKFSLMVMMQNTTPSTAATKKPLTVSAACQAGDCTSAAAAAGLASSHIGALMSVDVRGGGGWLWQFATLTDVDVISDMKLLHGFCYCCSPQRCMVLQ
jgi:hypothetical protein